MTTIAQINSGYQHEIYDHLQACYPEEGCGLLLGKLILPANGDRLWLIEAVEPMVNCWGEVPELNSVALQGDKRHYFAIDPKAMLASQKRARQRGLEIVGIYHSHPHGQPFPSEFDRAIAWPDYLYLIAAIVPGQALHWRSWYLGDDQQFQAIDVVQCHSTQ